METLLSRENRIAFATKRFYQCCRLRRYVSQVTPTIHYFYHNNIFFLRESIPKIVHLILKTRSLASILSENCKHDFDLLSLRAGGATDANKKENVLMKNNTWHGGQ